MPPAGLPGHTDAFASLYGRAPSVAKAKAALQEAGIAMPMPIELWWTPTHYGDASADEYAEIKRGLERGGVFKVTLKSAEWAQYSDALGKQYNAFQLGWFPDYPDAENYVLSFYQNGQLHLERLRQPEDDGAAQGGAGREDDSAAPRGHPADPAARREGRADHPRLAGQHDRGRRGTNVRGIPSTLDAAVHHAVLEAVQVVGRSTEEGAPGRRPSAARTVGLG